MRYFFFFAALMTGLTAGAQKGSWTIEPGQRPDEVMQPTDFVKYPQFRSGNVCFRDGYVKTALVNYSYPDAGIQFLSPSGDTLLLEGLEQLAYVAVGKDTFVFRPGVFEQKLRYPALSLLTRTRLQSGGTTKLGGYDANDPTGSAESVTRYNAYNQVRTTAVRERTSLVLKTEVFLLPAGAAEPEPASRKALERLLKPWKSRIADYLKQQRVDFDNPEELKALLDFLHS